MPKTDGIRSSRKNSCCARKPALFPPARLSGMMASAAICQARPRRRRASDGAVGFLNGVLGGLTGLAGILVTIWCNLRGWPKDVLRIVFQPVAVAIFLMSALWLGAKGIVTAETAKFFVIGLPCLVGTWLGLKLFGHIDEAAFRKIVLALLLVSGVTLLF
jgi:uncharacterized protein